MAGKIGRRRFSDFGQNHCFAVAAMHTYPQSAALTGRHNRVLLQCSRNLSQLRSLIAMCTRDDRIMGYHSAGDAFLGDGQPAARKIVS
ncbi:hypothetical protein, partial [Novosphingobium sp.]|uniref:hypothetical protein n=1 Tax=Novosphingobium sp. TaxID=1874826 RepID=UPI00286B8269